MGTVTSSHYPLLPLPHITWGGDWCFWLLALLCAVTSLKMWDAHAPKWHPAVRREGVGLETG